MDPYNMRLERGLSQTHFPHHFVAAIVYDLPWGKGRAHLNSGSLSWVLGGWQTSGIVSLQSGQQVWITQATNTARTFSRSFRPNLTGDPTLAGDQRTLLRYFNTAAFQAPPPLAIGNSNKFPNIQGPGTANTDFALIRFFPLPWASRRSSNSEASSSTCSTAPISSPRVAPWVPRLSAGSQRQTLPA